MIYTAGWNMPGYLPEMEPCSFDTWEEAVEFLYQELKDLAMNSAVEDPEKSAFYEGANQVKSWSGTYSSYTTSEMPDGYVYWININPD